jgi:hypothetical protein
MYIRVKNKLKEYQKKNIKKKKKIKFKKKIRKMAKNDNF